MKVLVTAAGLVAALLIITSCPGPLSAPSVEEHWAARYRADAQKIIEEFGEGVVREIYYDSHYRVRMIIENHAGRRKYLDLYALAGLSSKEGGLVVRGDKVRLVLKELGGLYQEERRMNFFETAQDLIRVERSSKEVQ